MQGAAVAPQGYAYRRSAAASISGARGDIEMLLGEWIIRHKTAGIKDRAEALKIGAIIMATTDRTLGAYQQIHGNHVWVPLSKIRLEVLICPN